jgi:hypothetical protein
MFWYRLVQLAFFVVTVGVFMSISRFASFELAVFISLTLIMLLQFDDE